MNDAFRVYPSTDDALQRCSVTREQSGTISV
jgi:hypothetical protein